MSYEITYDYSVFRIPASPGIDEPRYVVAVQCGSNNLYDTRRNRRVRDWNVFAVGTASEVLRRAIIISGSCEGGSLKPMGRDSKPEAFISKIRKLLADADKDGGATASDGYWLPLARLALKDPAVARAVELGGKASIEKGWSGEVAEIDFDGNLPGYFQFVSEEHRDRSGWNLARVTVWRGQ